jgi:hypothetical protein
MFIVAAPPSVRQGGNFLMSDTPETDSNQYHADTFTGAGGKTPVVHADFARRLERERDEERKEGEEQARLLGMGSEREAKLIAERNLWRAEAQRWCKQAIDLEGQIEAEIQRLQWRQHQLERGIKELKDDY